MCNLKEFDGETYNYFWKLANTPYSGVMIIDEFEYWEKLPQDFSDPWFKTLCHEVKIYKYDLEYNKVYY